jgi:hypothetical protein
MANQDVSVEILQGMRDSADRIVEKTKTYTESTVKMMQDMDSQVLLVRKELCNLAEIHRQFMEHTAREFVKLRSLIEKNEEQRKRDLDELREIYHVQQQTINMVLKDIPPRTKKAQK